MSMYINIMARFHRWRKINMSERTFLAILSILAGLLSGIAAVILKNTIRLTHHMVSFTIFRELHNYIYFALPITGIAITVLVIKYVLRKKVRPGIPNVLYGISKREGRISSHNLFSSVLTSTITVGFGGSVGLEGPTIAAGTAWGSWMARTFRLNYKNTIVVAASLTFGAGGAGGIFAPTLFMGVNTGLLFAQVNNLIGIHKISINNFALIGMAGLIAGVLHAPLTGIFLIADISGGYKLFVPLMITATFAYIIVRAYTPYSVYHFQLARRKELLTHDKDANVLQIPDVRKLIEDDFEKLSPEATLRDLTVAITRNHRNLFPVVDKDGKMSGMVKMDNVRELIFKQELYNKVKIKYLIYMTEYYIHPDDSMEIVANKFESYGRYNPAVIGRDGKYYGFISRTRVFTNSRKQIIDVSHV